MNISTKEADKKPGEPHARIKRAPPIRKPTRLESVKSRMQSMSPTNTSIESLKVKDFAGEETRSRAATKLSILTNVKQNMKEEEILSPRHDEETKQELFTPKRRQTMASCVVK